MTRSPLDRRKTAAEENHLCYDRRIDTAENMPRKGMNHIVPMIEKRAETLYYQRFFVAA